MKAMAIKTSPEYYAGYIDLVDDKPLLDVLPQGGIELYLDHFDELRAIGPKVYAKGKWTINQIVQHLIDTERIFINRALRFIREDDTDLPGYDHNAYVVSSRANDLTLFNLLEEYKAVRKSSELFFRPLTDEELLRNGTANGLEISALAIGYILVGHPTHHFNVLKDRYFGLR